MAKAVAKAVATAQVVGAGSHVIDVEGTPLEETFPATVAALDSLGPDRQPDETLEACHPSQPPDLIISFSFWSLGYCVVCLVWDVFYL